MYVDVLGLPSIAEAVREASRMLRQGIARAMVATVEDDTESEKDERPRTATSTCQPVSANVTKRDPVSVYSAVTKRTRKPKAVTEAAESPSRDPSPPPAQVTKEVEHSVSDDVSTKASVRAWSSTKKAGPSILTKRIRGQSASGSVSQSVFQPARKRERRSEDTRKSVSPLEQTLDDSGRATENGTSQEKQQAFASDAPRSTTATPLKPGMGPGLSRVTRVPPSDDKSQKAQPGIGSLGTRRTGLPPSWSQVTRSGGSRPVSAVSLLREGGKGSPLPKLLAELPSPKKKRSNLLAHPQVGSTKSGQVLPPVSMSLSGKPGGIGVIPYPSTNGIQVKYVPGSETIDGVRPNGYTVSRTGIVKPVVSFSPKPKLPHKLRQNSVEKLFEAWRDHARFVEGEALSKALRTEQELYAECSGRVDYRAAVTVKLKEIRK